MFYFYVIYVNYTTVYIDEEQTDEHKWKDKVQSNIIQKAYLTSNFVIVA